MAVVERAELGVPLQTVRKAVHLRAAEQECRSTYGPKSEGVPPP